MKVLHVITGLDVGGAENMLLRLITHTDRSSVQQEVISLTSLGVIGQRLEAMGIPTHVLQIRGPLGLFKGLSRGRAIAKKFAPDVIQSWLHHADLFSLGLKALGFIGPLIWNLRCADLNVADVPGRNRFLVRILARLSTFPSCVVANSFAGKLSHTAVGYHPRRWEVIGNGFDVVRFAPDAEARRRSRAQWNVASDAPVIGIVGRYNKVKGFPVFAKAASLFLQDFPHARFVLVGTNLDGANSELVSLLKQADILRAAILLGQQHDIAGVMNGLDLLASCSTTEGFPNVIGEAMACGVPCVATDAGDSALIIGADESVVAIGDTVGMAAAWKRHFELPPQERQERHNAARRRIELNFDINAVVRRYEDLYRELAAECGSAKRLNKMAT